MIDLHMHSTFSDGTLTPTELVMRAKNNNIDVVSLTDHDNIDGLGEGKEAADKVGITFINGIEISANYKNKDVHILGYFLNLEDNDFTSWLNKLREKRYMRTLEILKKLEKLGIDITIEEVKKEVTGNIIGRPHIANVILKKGYASTMNEVFDRYLGDGQSAYIPKIDIDAVEVVKRLKSNGAIVSLAHPHLIRHTDDTVINLIHMLVEAGLDGLELYYPNINIKKKNRYMKIVKNKNLLITGGSDFHGLNRTGVDVGLGDIPVEVYKKLKERKH